MIYFSKISSEKRLIFQLISLIDLLRRGKCYLPKKSFEEQDKEKGEEIQAEKGSHSEATVSLAKGKL